MKYYTILISTLLLLLTHFSAYSEGTAQVMPTSSNGTALLIKPEYGYGSYRGCSSDNRIYFNVKDNSVENLYFGLNKRMRLPSNGVPTDVYYRIVNPSGVQVVAPTAVPASGTGFINTYAEAVAGPNIGGLTPSGYTPITFDPIANGDYYIELYRSTDGGATAVTTANGEVYFIYFDFTVSKTDNTQYPGRVHCKKWSLIAYNPSASPYSPSIDYSFEGDYYGYTADSSVIRVEFGSGFRPIGYTVAMNYYGVANTNDFAVDRKSVYTGTTAPSLSNGYDVFLQTPDTSIYKISAAANPPIITGSIYGCPGAFYIPYYIDKPGDVSILLDLNGTSGYQEGTEDVVLEDYNVSAGNHVIVWDGNDGMGNPVTSGVSITITAEVYRGRTNVPIYDAEMNINGMTITSIYPATGSRKLFWDDASVADFGTCGSGNDDANNTTGVGITNDNPLVGSYGPTHGWNGAGPDLSIPAPDGGGGSLTGQTCDDFGNARTINTWFWADDIASDPSVRAIPSCDLDGDGVDDAIDLDDDNDGISDLIESGGVDPLADSDGDGLPNYIDPTYGGFTDANFDGVNDNFDKDKDGIINELDLDSDNDGLLDIIEAGGTDGNSDGIVDSQVDVNLNGIHDAYDIACNGSIIASTGGTSAGTTGTVTNTANILDANNTTYGILDNTTASIDILLNGTVSSGSIIVVRARRDDGTSKNFSVSRSMDDITYTQTTSYSATGTTSDFNFTLTGNAKYIRIASQSNDNALDIRIYHVSYSYTICNGTMGTAIANPDTDGDGIKNYLDLDSDNDGITDIVEAGGVDTNGDGYIDGTSDSDGDGIRNAYDANSGGDAISNTDTDGDGVKNYLDLDSDNDGIPDVVEVGKADTDNNGKIDSFTDTDSDGLAQSVDGDTNNDGTVESSANASIISGSDGNSDGIPDSYSRANNDANGLPNPYDLDADGDGILDVKEGGLTDATNDGIADGTLGADGWSDTVDALGSLNLPNTDSQGNANFIDIDSDNDGIVDIVEAQTTAGYIAPSGTDSDGDGIDNNFDNNDGSFGGSASNGLTPTNTDAADNADYIDLDSDNDKKSDRVEGWDTDGSGSTNGSEVSYIGTTDSDNDGLLNEYDIDDVNINPTNSSTASSHPDVNNPGGDRDWRQASDRDLDGKVDTIDIDDDNDGIPDTVESGGYDPLADGDSDGIANYLDSSPGAGLPTWTDSNTDNINDSYDKDLDGIINELDLDSDNDGIPDIIEATGTDSGNDGMVDSYVDTDNDGLSDQYDSNNGGVNIPNPDSDGDGVKNFLDLDADGDGLLDVREAGFTDTNSDGIVDGTLGTDGWSNTIDALGSLNLTNTDSHGNPNYIDIDADNDGIPDIIEAQSTLAYIAPSGSDSDADGIDNSYDNNDASFGGSSNNGSIPVNSESADDPDYLDLDTDGDLKSDRLEGWDTDGSGSIDNGEIDYIGTTDSDGDGLLNEYDVNDASWNPTNGTNPSSYPDVNDPGEDKDWREFESDNGYLPIQLISVKVELLNSEAIVLWETSSEINNEYFIIERSLDGIRFESLGKVQGAGNSNIIQHYQFIDKNPLIGISYYRITQVDFDGNTSNSKKMVLNNSSNVELETEIYPNPAVNYITVVTNQDITLEIYNISGSLIKSEFITKDYKITLSLTNLESGLYFLHIKGKDSTEVKKLVIE